MKTHENTLLRFRTQATWGVGPALVPSTFYTVRYHIVDNVCIYNLNVKYNLKPNLDTKKNQFYNFIILLHYIHTYYYTVQLSYS